MLKPDINIQKYVFCVNSVERHVTDFGSSERDFGSSMKNVFKTSVRGLIIFYWFVEMSIT